MASPATSTRSTLPSTGYANAPIDGWRTLQILRAGGSEAELRAKIGQLEVIEAQRLMAFLADVRRPSPTEAVDLAHKLMGQYRVRDFISADTFAEALTVVFESYPAALGAIAIHPIHGYPGEVIDGRAANRWPSVPDVKAWLDRELARIPFYSFAVDRAAKLIAGKNPS